MAEIQEKDWQYNKIRFGRDNMVRDKVNAPSDSTGDTTTGGIAVQLAPEVDRGNSFIKTMLSVGSAFNGYTNGAISIDSNGNVVAPENPYLEHFITFKNVGGKTVTAHKFKDFDNLETQLKNLAGTDSSGPFSTQAMQGTTLGFTASSGSLGAIATGGIAAALIGMTAGPKDPLTGEPTAQLIPMLSNAILKNKYEAIKKIRAAIKAQKADVGDAFTLGGFSFVREPGKYTFNGNLSAVGLSHEELHGLSAIARGFDPNSYNYKTGEGTRILTYGGTAGYMLDGRHVDYMGRIAGAGIGTMRSDTWRAMVMKHFNGNNDIAQQWLAGTEKFRGFSGVKDAEAAQAWFDQMTGNAYERFPMGQESLMTENVPETDAIRVNEDFSYTYGQNIDEMNALSGSKFIDRWNLDNINSITADYNSAFRKNIYSGGIEEQFQTETGSPKSLIGGGVEEQLYTETGEGFVTGQGSLMPQNIPEIDAATDAANRFRFGAGFSDFAQGRPTRPLDFSANMTDFMGRIANAPENTLEKLFPDSDKINITYYSSIGAENPLFMDGMAHKYKSHISGSWQDIRSEKVETDTLFKNSISAGPISAGISAQTGTQPTQDDDKPDRTGGTSMLKAGAGSQVASSIRDSSLDDKITAAAQATSYTPTFRKADNPRGFIGGFKEGGVLGYQEGDMVQGQPQLPEVVGGQMPSQVPDQQTVADNMPDTLKEGTFVLNAPAVELAGERDVKDMIMKAFFSARKKGLPIGETDNRLYERNVDVLLSKGEVTIPPELVKIIGLSKLRKLNNRGLGEVKRREAEAKKSQQASFPSEMGGMPQFRTGDAIQAASDNLDQVFGRKSPASNEEIYANQLNDSEMGAVFGKDFKLREPDPMAIQDGESEYEYKKRVGIIPKGQTEDEFYGRIKEKGGTGFLTAAPAGQPEGDLGLQTAMSQQNIKFANAITAAEWGGKYDTEETQAAGYFLRTFEAPKQGSSAYGPLQITGGLLASNFGDINHLENMRDSEQSVVKGPAKLMIENYNKGAKGALRNRLTNEEKKFVDALIDQANQFLIYGREKNREGYDPKFDYGGVGNIQEIFPNNYKQLYNSIGMKLIESLSQTVNGDPIEFAKLWKSGDDPKKKFKDNRYLQEFTKNLDGFDSYLDQQFDGKVIPKPNPMRQ